MAASLILAVKINDLNQQNHWPLISEPQFVNVT